MKSAETLSGLKDISHKMSFFAAVIMNLEYISGVNCIKQDGLFVA